MWVFTVNLTFKRTHNRLLMTAALTFKVAWFASLVVCKGRMKKTKLSFCKDGKMKAVTGEQKTEYEA